MTEIRRLDPEEDERLVREAVSWLDSQSLFYRNCDAAWGEAENADDYLRHMREDAQADFGVFEDGELVSVITLSLAGKDVYNSHLMVRRGSNVESVVIAAASVIKGLFENGMREGWSWIARKNYGARKILEAIGMQRDGVTRFKGQSHGQPIEWLRYSVRAL